MFLRTLVIASAGLTGVAQWYACVPALVFILLAFAVQSWVFPARGAGDDRHLRLHGP